jgi:hypothetical protein
VGPKPDVQQGLLARRRPFRHAADEHERILVAGRPLPRAPGKIPRADYVTLLNGATEDKPPVLMNTT